MHELEFIPSQYEEMIRLANYISQFKSQEMEITFAKFMQKQMNPPMIVKLTE